MQIISTQQIEQFWCLENYKLFVSAEKQLAHPLFSSYSALQSRDSISYFYSEIVPLLSRYVTFHQIPSSPTKDYICTLLLHTLLYVSTWVVFEFETLALEFWCHLAAKLKKWKPDLHFRALCPIHVVTCTLISNLVTDYIQKRRGEPGLFFFEYNLAT